MANNVGYIYRWTNKATRKVYIGLDTTGNRKKRHCYDARDGSQTHFHRALRKYPSMEYWEWDIIGVTTNTEQLKSMEVDLILQHNSYADGYNSTQGGDGCFGRVTSDETKAKISAANSGRTLSPERKQQIREYRLGSKASVETRREMSRTRKGKRLYETTKQLISEARTGMKFTDEHRENISKSKKGVAKTTKEKERSRDSMRQVWQRRKDLAVAMLALKLHWEMNNGFA